MLAKALRNTSKTGVFHFGCGLRGLAVGFGLLLLKAWAYVTVSGLRFRDVGWFFFLWLVCCVIMLCFHKFMAF